MYYERRTRDWVKIKAQLDQEFVIGGWTDPRGSRKGFGALLLGAYDGKKLRFVGSVGTGFTTRRITEIIAKLAPLARATSPFVNEVEASSGVHWVKPELVAAVRFTEWTRDEHLRHPAFPARSISNVPASDMNVMPPRVMAGVIGARMTPCAMMRPCVSRRSRYGNRCRTQSQCQDTKRSTKRETK